ncbi:MAG TPA: cyanophycin synthetase [Gemmatimonas sp.]|nr:cyanophycin synthetase [Gemmatimonas sp.]
MTHASASAALVDIDPSELKLTRVRAMRGPNYWRLAPVITADLTLGSLETVSSAEMPEFTERLLAAMPTLQEHRCSLGRPGGFVERLHQGTYVPHILEHVALELQTLAGSDVHFGRVVQSGDPGVWWVIVAYEEEDVGIASMHEGARVIRHAISGESLDAGDMVQALCRLREDVRLGPSTWAIVKEARRRGIPVRRLNSRSLVQLGLGRNLRRIQATVTGNTSSIAAEIAQDKEDTKRTLESVGLPVPSGKLVRSVDAAIAAAEGVGYPVILKPLNLNHGRGISGRLDTPEDIRGAWEESTRVPGSVIVERFVDGRDHRVLVVDGKVVACAERVPAHVVGDGTSTIRELVQRENKDPRRGRGHTKVLTLLPLDEQTEQFLAHSDRTVESVPAAGEMVFLRATANLSTGGTSIDRTDDMHPDNVTACEMAAGIIGLDIAGIDVLTPDIGVPFRENGAVIIEVNAGPGVRMHTHPTEGTARNVGAAIIDMLYKPGQSATIPLIAVTGTNGKTTTTRLIAHLFRHTGGNVAFTTTDGIYLGNRLVIEGDMTGPFSANVILSNPTVDVAVLETARGGILRAGLGFDECDVGVVMNVTADHLGLRGIHTVEQLADVKGVIPAVTKRDGHAILNADDPLVLAMRDRTGADIVLFSTRAPGTNPAIEAHLEKGGIAARVENETFVIYRGRLRIPIASVRDVPLMVGGAARFQAHNVLAAMLAAFVRGVRYDDIRTGLLSFFPSPTLTPGRLNLMRVGKGRVLVDYAHNAAAIEGLVEFVRGLDARRRVAVVTGPGDRRDDDLRTLGRLVAVLDHVVIKEDENGRGRPKGQIAGLIREGLNAGGLPDSAIAVELDEFDAVNHIVDMLDDGDLAIILVNDVQGVLKLLRDRGARS